MIKLIAFDLDGTLLTYDKHVTERTRQTLAKAAAAGIECVPITGRPYSALPAEVLDLPGVNYVVAASGADIRDNRSGEILKKDLIDKNLIVEILTLLRNNGYVTMAFMDSRGYVEKEDFKKALDWALDGPFREYFLKNRTPVDDLIGMVRDYPDDVEKFTVNLPKDDQGNQIGTEDVLELLKPYEDKLHIVYGGAINIEVSSATAFKGNALLYLYDLLGMDKEEAITFGDSGNDLDMVGCAGKFIAMANASDEVKAAADYVTLSHTEDGVADYIEKFVL